MLPTHIKNVVTELSLIADDLRRGVPCGQRLGHGEECSPGWLCDGCSARASVAARLDAVYRRVLAGLS
jgi:hypothetical protein